MSKKGANLQGTLQDSPSSELDVPSTLSDDDTSLSKSLQASLQSPIQSPNNGNVNVNGNATNASRQGSLSPSFQYFDNDSEWTTRKTTSKAQAAAGSGGILRTLSRGLARSSDQHFDEWTPEDSAYGAACPICGCLPKNVRRAIEMTLIAAVFSALIFLVVATSIRISNEHSSQATSSSSNYGGDDDYASVKLDDDYYIAASNNKQYNTTTSSSYDDVTTNDDDYYATTEEEDGYTYNDDAQNNDDNGNRYLRLGIPEDLI